MDRNRQQGMVLPFMLVLLTMLTLVAGQIYSRAEQQRSSVRALVQHSQATTLLFSMESMVLKKLPTLNIRLFQQLQGKAITEPLRFDFPLPQGYAELQLTSAQQCLNLAPLEEKDLAGKRLTQKLLVQLGVAPERIPSLITPEGGLGILPSHLISLLCYLPGAGQHWDIQQLNEQHFPLLLAALPDEGEASLRRALHLGLTTADLTRINDRLGFDLLVTGSRYYWLEFSLTGTASIFRGRDLVKTDGRSASVIRRRLIDDDAL
ncbi:type II secretion system protein GspK [Ewingella americana]|uniref:type II secretion system protein GspK n=1 Tax=Ewingella americana TaxID=41202 RepID=UPI0012AE90EC|nr:type II secretion system protein GspK [Ewingella americana]MRT05936.1 hypothetical protein [Ewingella americana]